MDPYLQQMVCHALGATQIVETETIQTLWSGYGKIARYAVLGDGVAQAQQSVVIKHVCLPEAVDHPRGWNTNRSHQRKVKSYEVEAAWYAHWSHRCSPACRLPRCLAHGARGSERVLVLEDLDASGYPLCKTSINRDWFDACVAWLAHFHATFMLQPPEPPAASEFLGGLWPKGTYWHLATRLDELEALTDQALKQAAARIDETLTASPFQTLVHGDAKLANFCFSESGQVAAVDFQYVGGGCGMKDLAYFVGSCLDSDACFAQENRVLDLYFRTLKTALRQQGNKLDAESLEADWRHLYPYAWADFHRFLQGWSPGHWKISDYSHHMTRRVIDACV